MEESILARRILVKWAGLGGSIGKKIPVVQILTRISWGVFKSCIRGEESYQKCLLCFEVTMLMYKV